MPHVDVAAQQPLLRLRTPAPPQRLIARLATAARSVRARLGDWLLAKEFDHDRPGF
jgi:hypothetical protein